MSFTDLQLRLVEDLFLRSRLGNLIQVTEDGCWLWTGTKASWGYGYINWRGKHCSAHGLLYRLIVGEVPKGLELAHICLVNSCCNPLHMKPCTHAENCAMEVEARRAA